MDAARQVLAYHHQLGSSWVSYPLVPIPTCTLLQIHAHLAAICSTHVAQPGSLEVTQLNRIQLKHGEETRCQIAQKHRGVYCSQHEVHTGECTVRPNILPNDTSSSLLNVKLPVASVSARSSMWSSIQTQCYHCHSTWNTCTDRLQASIRQTDAKHVAGQQTGTFTHHIAMPLSLLPAHEPTSTVLSCRTMMAWLDSAWLAAPPSTQRLTAHALRPRTPGCTMACELLGKQDTRHVMMTGWGLKRSQGISTGHKAEPQQSLADASCMQLCMTQWRLWHNSGRLNKLTATKEPPKGSYAKKDETQNL